MPLTDTAVRQAKPKDKAYKLSDAGGLYHHGRRELRRENSEKNAREKLSDERRLAGTYGELAARAREHEEHQKDVKQAHPPPLTPPPYDNARGGDRFTCGG